MLHRTWCVGFIFYSESLTGYLDNEKLCSLSSALGLIRFLGTSNDTVGEKIDNSFKFEAHVKELGRKVNLKSMHLQE